MNIYVGNLGPQASDDDLRSLFSAYGEVTSSRVMRDRFSNEPRGFGFVEMATKSDAINAINELNGRDLHGKALTVNEARPKTESRGGNGGGRGGYSGGNGGGGRRNSW